eukprot:5015539-Heterocapsa_arctica.AAC.1
MTEFGEYDASVDLTTSLSSSWRTRPRRTRTAGSTRVLNKVSWRRWNPAQKYLLARTDENRDNCP